MVLKGPKFTPTKKKIAAFLFFRLENLYRSLRLEGKFFQFLYRFPEP